MKTKLLCTLGPASLDAGVIAALDERQVDLFRVNLSHTPLGDLKRTIEFIQQHTATPICIDTEGAQVRCGTMWPDVLLTAGDPIELTATEVVGSGEELTLRPRSVFRELEVGSVASIDFDCARIRITEVAQGRARAVVLEAGRIGSNKAVTVVPSPRLPALTEYDVKAIKIALRYGITHFALSFASHANDVARLRALLPPGAHVIAKIESRAGVRSIDGIADRADAVLIDRGDLSREVAIEYVPACQKHIIQRANARSTPVFVATNLLESMLVNRTPTLAEANDIINTLGDGAQGLVLAAETAIGKHPVESVDVVRRLAQAFSESAAEPVPGQSLGSLIAV